MTAVCFISIFDYWSNVNFFGRGMIVQKTLTWPMLKASLQMKSMKEHILLSIRWQIQICTSNDTEDFHVEAFKEQWRINLFLYQLKVLKSSIAVPSNGILSTMIGIKGSSLTTINPTVSGFTLIDQIPIMNQSTLMAIYQASNKLETRYHPVQALQSCYRL